MIISQNPSNQNPENDAQYHYPGGPNQMVKVGHAGIANSEDELLDYGTQMTKRHPRSQPTWTDVKAKLADLDRTNLMGLVQDLYAAHKDNQTFLHTRFGLGEDVLKPYKETLERWLWPDVLRNQDISVAKAKQAISSYRKAVGEPAGLAELMVSFLRKCGWLLRQYRVSG
jgi:hypothetical protein